MAGEGVVLRVCTASRGQRRDEDGLQRDEDLAEGRLLHQTFELLEVDAHAEGGAVAVHLNPSTPRSHYHNIDLNLPQFTEYVVCVCLYRLVAELQQLVRQLVGVTDEFLQRIFEADGFFQDLIAAVHPHRVGRL